MAMLAVCARFLPPTMSNNSRAACSRGEAAAGAPAAAATAAQENSTARMPTALPEIFMKSSFRELQMRFALLLQDHPFARSVRTDQLGHGAGVLLQHQVAGDMDAHLVPFLGIPFVGVVRDVPL